MSRLQLSSVSVPLVWEAAPPLEVPASVVVLRLLEALLLEALVSVVLVSVVLA